jgi:LAS superfamily LD-carboxypeptidase LdcB
MSTLHKVAITVLVLTTVIMTSSSLYLYTTSQKQQTTIDELTRLKDSTEQRIASTTSQLTREREQASSTIHELSSRLSLTSEELSEIEDDLRREKNRNEDFEDQIKDLAGTVGVLDKLSKTDEELLQKYSRTYFLNENFRPLKLAQIDQDYVFSSKNDQYFHGDAVEYLTDLLDAAKKAGYDIKIISAFRSFEEQAELKGQYTQVYGSGSNAFSADQGYSEHQLGTTVDIADTATGGAYTSFADTKAFSWLQNNAHRYGFILSYPKGNQFYVFEPWHWRFVGRDLAEDLKRKEQSFYDLDQRELDAYLVTIFD